MTGGRILTIFCGLLISTLPACVAEKSSEEELLGPASVTNFVVAEGSPTLAPGDSIRLKWGLSAPDLFQIDLHLSLDGTLDDGDEKVLGFGCGASITDEPAECRGTSDCMVEEGMNGPGFRCGDPASPILRPVLLSNLFGGPEGSAVLILRACNALFEGCDFATIPVTFTGR
jgi:hypothetical protein